MKDIEDLMKIAAHVDDTNKIAVLGFLTVAWMTFVAMDCEPEDTTFLFHQIQDLQRQLGRKYNVTPQSKQKIASGRLPRAIMVSSATDTVEHYTSVTTGLNECVSDEDVESNECSELSDDCETDESSEDSESSESEESNEISDGSEPCARPYKVRKLIF